MAKTLLQFCNTLNTYAPGVTEFLSISNAQNPSATGTEAQRQIKAKFAGVYSGLRVRVNTNSLSTATTTIVFRKNGANGNQTVSIPAGATGVFEDTTNSDTIADGDFFSLSVSTASGGTGTINTNLIQMRVSKTVGIQQIMAGSGVPSTATASTSYFGAFGGTLVNATTIAEARKQPVVRASSTLANMQLYVISNGRSTDTLLRSRKNGANGNMLITVPAGATGYFEDTTNSDSLAAGDNFNYAFTTGTGAGTISWSTISAFLTPTGTIMTPLLAASNNATVTFAVGTLFHPFGGSILGTIASEANAYTKYNYSATLSNLFLSVSANTHTGTRTINFRKNGANGNQTFTISAGATGYFEDTTNTDAVVANDLVNMQLSGGTTGVLSVIMAGVHQTVTDPVAVTSNQRITSRLNLGLGAGITRYI